MFYGAAVFLLTAVGLVVAFETRDALAASDEKLTLDGVANFGRITPHLYRGAQPEVSAYSSLRRFGIDTVVRLSTGDEFIEGERARVEALRMRFVSLPWRTADTPTTEQVATFLALLRDHPDWTVFVHCRKGVDRTGVMVALYRIALDHWAADQAVWEMRAFHYRPIFQPHLQDYVEGFPQLLAFQPALRTFAATPH